MFKLKALIGLAIAAIAGAIGIGVSQAVKSSEASISKSENIKKATRPTIEELTSEDTIKKVKEHYKLDAPVSLLKAFFTDSTKANTPEAKQAMFRNYANTLGELSAKMNSKIKDPTINNLAKPLVLDSLRKGLLLDYNANNITKENVIKVLQGPIFKDIPYYKNAAPELDLVVNRHCSDSSFSYLCNNTKDFKSELEVLKNKVQEYVDKRGNIVEDYIIHLSLWMADNLGETPDSIMTYAYDDEKIRKCDEDRDKEISQLGTEYNMSTKIQPILNKRNECYKKVFEGR